MNNLDIYFNSKLYNITQRKILNEENKRNDVDEIERIKKAYGAGVITKIEMKNKIRRVKYNSKVLV